ncbi:hypothetical protein [Pontivivens ytuae]|uniref:Uncharacterized protein n=1 Tax=Pontivivens ytuae TaxID=2789856 RepID=A0A7S9LSU4_9RHOB|nr:hypothetical protein [Pontivivens ytuae]QPH54677.1 hypothetical protein I0K15_02525 [Pontivivens ytuae]
MDGGIKGEGDLARVFMAAVANSAAGKPSAEIDLQACLHLLDDMDAPDEQKLELLAIVANIVTAFVDMGFGLHPIQQSCGQIAERDAEHPKASESLVKSEFNERKNE